MLGEIVQAGRRNRELDLLQHDAVAAFALLPGGDHARVILIGGEHFVARLQAPCRVERSPAPSLALRVMAISSGSQPNDSRQPAPHRFDARIENVPHVVRRVQVLHFEIADLGVHHDLRRGRDAAVVQIDHVAIDGERMADVEPEVFIARDCIGGAAGNRRHG